MSIRLNLLRAVVITAVLTGSAGKLSGQIELQARHGARWSNDVTLPAADSLTLRWKWVGLPNVTTASWQISYASPASAGSPSVMRNVSTTVPLENRYQFLRIAASDLPGNLPATFYVRIRGPNRYSNWVTIRISHRAGAVAQGGRGRGAPQSERENARAAAGGQTKDEPFIIPGGDAKPKTGELTVVDMSNTPMWIRLTQMQCNSPQLEDNDNSDEVYAVIVTVRPKAGNLAQSGISASATKVYTIDYCNKSGEDPEVVFPNTPVWGPEEGAPLPLRVPYDGANPNPDALIMIALMERDSDGHNIPLLLELLRGKIRAQLSYPLANSIGLTMRSILEPNATSTAGDDLIGMHMLRITEEELERAWQGAVVRLESTVTSGSAGFTYGTKPNALSSGSWSVEFQLGRQGVQVQGLHLATCNDGKPWYGWSLFGVCNGRGGIRSKHLHNWALLND